MENKSRGKSVGSPWKNKIQGKCMENVFESLRKICGKPIKNLLQITLFENS